MLATATYSSQQTFNFLPAIPSPLSPRSANIYGRRPPFMSSDQTPSKSSHTPYSQRAVKKAPSPGQDALNNRRRNMFLRKVKEGREDKRFDARADDIMRLEFIQRQKQWETEQARLAPQMSIDSPEADDDYDLPQSSDGIIFSGPSTQFSIPEEEAEEALQREQEELQALMSLLHEEESKQRVKQEQNMEMAEDHTSEHFGSDDDDYEALFSDLINDDAHVNDHAELGFVQHSLQPSQDEMDMT